MIAMEGTLTALAFIFLAAIVRAIGWLLATLEADLRAHAAKLRRPRSSPNQGTAGEVALLEELPTVETLDKNAETANKNPKPSAIEWAPYTDEELSVMEKLHAWCKDPKANGKFADIPADTLAAFVRGYSYRPDWPDACFAYLNEALAWRKTNVDTPTPLMLRTGDQLPPNREQFETFFVGGPVGWDDEGHPVILDRACTRPPDELFATFDEAAVIDHLAFSRELQRAYCNAACVRSKKRIYKVVLVVDVSGLTLAHTGSRFIGVFRTANSLFSYYYPETIARLYVVNAPFVFSALYRLIKPFLHPITVAKIDVYGSDYASTLAARGVHLDGGALPDKPPGWLASITALRAKPWPGVDEKLMQRGWVPPADEAAMRKRGLL